MEMWTDIRRRILVDGESKRSIMREYNIHYKTLQKILEHDEPPGYRRIASGRPSKLDPYLQVIEQILIDDRTVHKKQRHTVKRIWERLRDEHGFDGGYTIVKDAVQRWRLTKKEVFVPLSHPPGEAQMDFGHAWIEWQGQRWQAALFVITLPYSDAFYVQAFPRECTESFQEGHRRAFEFFGGVPRRISYDNSKIAVAKITGKRDRKLTREFLRLQSHYLYKEHFCLVRRPNEKGKVETLVGFSRRNFLVPIPKVESFAQLNQMLEERCRADLERQLRGKDATKAELLAEELTVMLPLPAGRFEARKTVKAQANSLSLVRFDRNDYSVPTEYAHHAVTAVGSVDEVRFVVDNRLVSRHQRCWEKERTFFNPTHYLALLERKPGAFDFARPLEQWQLPDCFELLRRRLEAEQEDNGTREYIKVLRLLEASSVTQLRGAVEQALDIGAIGSDAVRCILEQRREAPVSMFSLDGRPHLKAVRVSQPDLSAYSTLTEAVPL